MTPRPAAKVCHCGHRTVQHASKGLLRPCESCGCEGFRSAALKEAK